MKLFKEFIITREVFLNLLIMLMWGHLLLSYFRGFIGMVPGIGIYQMEAQVVLVVCIIVAALPSVMNRMAVIDWLFLASCLCIYILNLGIFHKNYDLENVLYPMHSNPLLFDGASVGYRQVLETYAFHICFMYLFRCILLSYIHERPGKNG